MTARAHTGRTLIASDWHLGHFSPPGAARLASTFLERALDSGDDVILNGDIFEGLFEPVAAAEAAHPDIRRLIAELTAHDRLRRTEGNHDPGSGVPSLVLDHPVVGRVLVAHGHAVDPVQRTRALHTGDAISRRFGRLAPVRGAAHVAELVTMSVVGRRVEGVFRECCLRAVDAAVCSLGIFGHVHRRHLVPGDRYANAGRLHARRLEYLVLGPRGPELDCLELDAPDAARPDHHRNPEPVSCSPG